MNNYIALGRNGMGQDVQVGVYDVGGTSIEVVAWTSVERDEFDAVELSPANEEALRGLLNMRHATRIAPPGNGGTAAPGEAKGGT